jgi:hypothetical protein
MNDKGATKKFGCLKCGEPFEVHPPDDIHKVATRFEKESKDPVKVEYTCKKCGNVNVLFWGHRPTGPAWSA